MTKQDIRSDLHEIRYYYMHRDMFEKAGVTVIQSNVLEKSSVMHKRSPMRPSGCICCTSGYTQRTTRSFRWRKTWVTARAISKS